MDTAGGYASTGASHAKHRCFFERRPAPGSARRPQTPHGEADTGSKSGKHPSACNCSTEPRRRRRRAWYMQHSPDASLSPNLMIFCGAIIMRSTRTNANWTASSLVSRFRGAEGPLRGAAATLLERLLLDTETSSLLLDSGLGCRPFSARRRLRLVCLLKRLHSGMGAKSLNSRTPTKCVRPLGIGTCTQNISTGIRLPKASRNLTWMALGTVSSVFSLASPMPAYLSKASRSSSAGMKSFRQTPCKLLFWAIMKAEKREVLPLSVICKSLSNEMTTSQMRSNKCHKPDRSLRRATASNSLWMPSMALCAETPATMTPNKDAMAWNPQSICAALGIKINPTHQKVTKYTKFQKVTAYMLWYFTEIAMRIKYVHPSVKNTFSTVGSATAMKQQNETIAKA
mmetsp:Transcript_105191/g.304260  ORF Transcript_105191/g.304260 Transcript_105191/m.304260 type:complete len:399 (+) Transcript_105191:168-1364(+)